MSHHRDDWQQDLVRRQRNIVFPDTVENEGRFWRGILRGEIRLNRIQKIGAVVVLVLTIAIWGSVIVTMVSEQDAGRALWARVLNIAVPLAAAMAMLLVFMGVIGWQIRREQRRRGRKRG